MNERANAPPPNADVLRRLGIEKTGSGFTARRKFWLAAAIAAAAALALVLWFSGSGAPQYVTAEVTRGDLRVTVNATGTLQPEDQVDVGAEISGRIDAVLVDFNDRVAKGQVLAELDTEQLEARLAQSRAALQAARANVEQSNATLTETRARTARTEELFAREVVAMQELETARADLGRAEANASRARADAALAAAQVDADQTALSKAAIRSPIDGVVLNRLVEPGQSVAASFQTPVLFTLASDLSQMELLVDIDEADIGAVREGQMATFTVDAYPQREFTASLVSVRNAPQTVNNVVTYQGVLLVDNSSGLLRPGLTANADIVVAELGDALLVPNGALRVTPDSAETGGVPPPAPQSDGVQTGRVWVLEGSRPVPRDLGVGVSDGALTEIVSGDLAAGDAVITDIGNAFAP